MNEVDKLSNQHFLEWESRLERIDEMLGRANAMHANAPKGSEAYIGLANATKARNEVAVDLTKVRALPVGELINTTDQSVGLRASFEAIGLQLEKLLAVVFNGT